MKTIDNFPMDKPTVGVFIEEDYSVGQFKNNCLYLITDEESSLARKAVTLMEGLSLRMQDEDLFNSYELKVVSNVELDLHPKIKERIEQYGDNLLIQLYTPTDSTRKFIVSKTNEENLLADIGLIMRDAEGITKIHISKILKSFAIDQPDEFEHLSRNSISNKNFFTDYFISLSNQMMHPVFGMAASMASIKERLDIKGIVPYQKRLEIFDHLLDNLRKFRKHPDPKIEAELDLIFNAIDPATWKIFFLKQSPQIQEKMNNFVNPRRMAENSTMDLEICKAKIMDKSRKNDGHYRLYLKRGEEKLMVHFTRKNGFILYLIYLLDRKKNGDGVDTLNIAQYKQLFGRLYEMVYGINGETIFTDMMKNFNVNNEVQQKGLYTVLKSIRDDVGSACERMQEPADPFLLQDMASHLAVLPEHIILPSEILELVKC